MTRHAWLGATLAACLLCLAVPALGQPGRPSGETLRLVHGGLEREALVFVPPGRGSRLRPAVIHLHGGGSDARVGAARSGVRQAAAAHGFLAVFPDGTGELKHRVLTWNAGYCCGFAAETGVDDVGYLRELIGALVARYRVDPSRVYLSGFSNGGMLAYRAACELSDLVAGIGVVSGAMPPGACRPARPVSVLAVHGTADRHVRYEGGPSQSPYQPSRMDQPFAATVRFWADADACPAESARERREAALFEHYEGCRDGTSVAAVTIEGGGHAWPGGSRLSRYGDKPYQGFAAAQLLLDFFAAHPRH